MSRRDPPAIGLTIWAFKAQRRSARSRGIPFLLTYEQWLRWWQTELAKRGPLARRGVANGGLGMLRYGDKGPYALGNIFAGTQAENNRSMHTAGGASKSITALKAYAAEHGYPWTGRTGADHPRSRPVAGFPSVTAAAAHYHVSRTEIRRRIAEGRLRPE